jgi:hypothetical protein
MAGIKSVPTSMKRFWITVNAKCTGSTTYSRCGTISGMLLVRTYVANLRIFAKTARPLSDARHDRGEVVIYQHDVANSQAGR